MLLTITFFCVIVLVMTFVEHSQYKTFITPFTVMVWPYIFIVLFLLMFGWHRKYNPVSVESIGYVAVNVVVLWLTGQVMWFVLRGQQSLEVNSDLEDFITAHYKIFLAVVGLGILAGISSFIKTGLTFGFNTLGTESFQLAFCGGILGHITIQAYPSFILLAAYWLKNHGKILFVFLLLMVFIVLANQIKYRTVLLILPAVYLAIQSKMVKKLKAVHLVVIGLVILAIFVLAYFIGFSSIFGFNRACRLLPYIFGAFEDYLVGGSITLGYFLRGYENYLSPDIVFTVPLNVIRFITGEFNYVNPIIPFFVPIASQFAVKNNTGTIFTTLYMCLGFYGSLIFMMVMGLLIYTIYNLALSKRGIVLSLLSAHLLGILTLSFFGYHFHLLPLWEVGISMIITPYAALAAKKILSVRTA